MKKFTKLVATIGPATETEEVLGQLIEAGMNIARFNTKHSDPEWHNERIQRVNRVAAKLGKPVAILLDLQGPEIRINLPEEKSFDVEKGDTVAFTANPKANANNLILVPQNVVESLPIEQTILLEDGACEFFVVDRTADYVIAQALVSCTVSHRKTMNTPGLVLEMPSLTERDYNYLNGVKPELVDFVGLSFVRSANDIAILRKELDERGMKADIVAKIENQSAVDNIDEIIAVSDAVMVARGDLGVEVPYEELIHWQKTIINKCRNAAKPVITATEMLKSMVAKPRPTRAEVSDVAHAIYDGTDAVMLSDETTIGKYPVKAVSVQATIATYNEPLARAEGLKAVTEEEHTPTSAITSAAARIINLGHTKIDKVVCLTETGQTVRMLSRFRLPANIHAVTSNEATLRKMNLLYGVTPHMLDLESSTLDSTDKMLQLLEEKGIVNKGETVLYIHGSVWKHPGLTNALSLVTI